MTSELGALRTRASQGAIVSLLGQGGAQVLRLAGNLVLARLLFPEAFGLMAIVYLIVFALDQFSNIGIPAAIMRFDRGDTPTFLNTAFTIQVIRGVVLWVAGLLATPLVADFYAEFHDDLMKIMPVATFAAVIMGWQSTNFLVLTRRLLLGRRVAIELIGRICSVVFMVTWAWVEPSVWALVYGGLVNVLVITILSHAWIPGPRVGFAWDRETVDEVMSLGKWVFASSGLSFVLAQIDIALLGRLVRGDVLGVYSMGIIIATLLRDTAYTVLSSVVAPVVAESNREGPEVLRNRYAALRRVTLPAALTAALGALVVSPAFFDFLYDERYQDAQWIAQLALIRFWFAYLQVHACISLLSLGDGRSWTVSNVLGLIGTTTGCLVGFELGDLRGLLIGLGIGSAAAFVQPAIELARIGVARPGPELRYTAAGIGLGTLAVVAIEASAPYVPLRDSLRSLVVGGGVLAPYAAWAALRVLREFKRR